MRIQSVGIYSTYQTYRAKGNVSKSNKEVSLVPKSSSIADELSVKSSNPILSYAKNLFKRSLVASARKIEPIDNKLMPILNEVSINSTKREHTYAWDINNHDSKKYVLYLHGASQNISNLQPLYKNIIENTNYSILALEYRGFGKNAPKDVASRTFLEDTTAAIKYLKEQKGIESNNITVIGHSMGAYPAAQLAAKQNNFEKLILISPMGSVAKQSLDVNVWFAKRMPPITKFLFKNFKILRKPLESFFNIEGYLKKINIPIDIIHAKNDRLIKYTSSQEMSTICQNLHSINILPQGGHKMEIHKMNAIVSLLNAEG